MQLIVSMAEIAPKSNVVSNSSSSSDLKSEKKNALTDEASVPRPDVSTPDISDYTDHSRDAVASNNNAYASGYGTASKEPPFPVKLHKMLSNPEFRDIIAWLPHGRAWRVLQPKALEEKVIPLFFRHTRYSSFTRQVNGWGFRRVSSGSDYNSYYHELFLRGCPHLCTRMHRLTKDPKARKKTVLVIPDFYLLSRKNPLPEDAPVPSRIQPLSTSLTVPTAATAMPATTPVTVAQSELQNPTERQNRVQLFYQSLQAQSIRNQLQQQAAAQIPNAQQQALALYAQLPILQQQQQQAQAQQLLSSLSLPATGLTPVNDLSALLAKLQADANTTRQLVLGQSTVQLPNCNAVNALLQFGHSQVLQQQQWQLPTTLSALQQQTSQDLTTLLTGAFVPQQKRDTDKGDGKGASGPPAPDN